jgi:hypothetical protein
VLVLLLTACGDDAAPPHRSDAGAHLTDAGLEGPRDGGALDTAAFDAGGSPDACSESRPEACAYVPPARYEPGAEAERSVRYTDVTGATREIVFEIRAPRDAPPNAPVVLWSHGGSQGLARPGRVGVEWGRAFNRAGYVSVHIAHAPRDTASRIAQCEAIGLSGCDAPCTTDADCTTYSEAICADGVCAYFQTPNWDRPHDVRAVIDWLEREAAAGGPLEGRIDLTRIAYAGHSGGAGGTMMIAGASRTYPGRGEIAIFDPRPIAFISCSPQPPGEDGFTETSFDASICTAGASDPSLCLTRPHLVMTGVGDDTGVTGETRRAAYDLVPAGDKRLFFVLEEGARHGTFELDRDPCTRYAAMEGLDAARCEDYERWLANTAVAFLDAYVRGLPEAQAYLASDAPALYAAGAAEWTSR